MRIVYEYSHLGGKQILQVDYPKTFREIGDVINAIGRVSKTKVSKEKTMRGKLLYAPTELNSRFATEFHRRGFREVRDRYDISIPNYR